MIKDLMQKEEKLLAEFMRLLFVDNNSARDSFIQERLTTLRVMEIQEIEFMRDFPCAETKEKRLLLRLFPNQLSIESIIFQPLFDTSLRLFHHFCRRNFFRKENMSSEFSKIFFFQYRFLECVIMELTQIGLSSSTMQLYFALRFDFPPLEGLDYSILLNDWVSKEDYLPFEKEKVLLLWESVLKEYATMTEEEFLMDIYDERKILFLKALNQMRKSFLTDKEMKQLMEKMMPNEDYIWWICDTLSISFKVQSLAFFE